MRYLGKIRPSESMRMISKGMVDVTWRHVVYAELVLDIKATIRRDGETT